LSKPTDFEIMCDVAGKLKTVDEIMAVAFDGLTTRLSEDEVRKICDVFFEQTKDLNQSNRLFSELDSIQGYYK
jgi:hypothetical protein